MSRSSLFVVAVSALLPLLALGGCASGPVERGWVGGAFAPVRAGAPGLVDPGPFSAPDAPCAVQGLPAEAGAARGLLLVDVPDAAPLAAAGLRRGDVILQLDGADVGTPEELRAAVADREPGAELVLKILRDGETLEQRVTIGAETVERGGMLRLGLRLHGGLDLWPFDDGIDLLGLVTVAWRTPRTDLHDTRAEHAVAQGADRARLAPPRPTFDLTLVPIGIGRTERVVSQTR